VAVEVTPVTSEVWGWVWQQVADELDQHRVRSLERLLTEDVVRFATVRALVDAGVDPVRLRSEWRPARNQAIDLVVDDPVSAAVEFKYPREPHETNAAWTQHLGEVVKDFYRLATLPEHVGQRWCVQVVSARLRRYLDGVSTRTGVSVAAVAGGVTTLTPAGLAGLPATARNLLGPWHDPPVSVTACCVHVLPIGDGLTLTAHLVERATAAGGAGG
jgi:hypothetical protein